MLFYPHKAYLQNLPGVFVIDLSLSCFHWLYVWKSEGTLTYSKKCSSLDHDASVSMLDQDCADRCSLKLISQYDTTMIRRYHDAFDYDEVVKITICVRFDCDRTTI